MSERVSASERRRTSTEDQEGPRGHDEGAAREQKLLSRLRSHVHILIHEVPLRGRTGARAGLDGSCPTVDDVLCPEGSGPCVMKKDGRTARLLDSAAKKMRYVLTKAGVPAVGSDELNPAMYHATNLICRKVDDEVTCTFEFAGQDTVAAAGGS